MTNPLWLWALPVRRRQSSHPQASVATLAVAADEVAAAVIGPVTVFAPVSATVVVIAVVAALALAADQVTTTVVVVAAGLTLVAAALTRGAAGGDA